MAVDNYIEFKTNSIADFVKFLKNDLYLSCHNNIVTEKTNDRGRNYRFENNNISAKVQTMRTTDIEFNRSEYKVDVNCAVILREYSDTEANSEKNIFSLIIGIIKHFKGDFLYMPNGDEPIIIKHNGNVIVEDTFDNYFGEGMKKEFKKKLDEK